MSFSSYGYIEEVSMTSRTFEVKVSALDRIISVTENGSLLASLSFALNNNILQLIGKNDLEVAAIELPNSDKITNAYYDKINKKIVLEVQMADGSISSIDIDVADLVVIYEGGNGIDIDDNNSINVKIADDSSQYLVADSNGLALKFKTLDDHFVNMDEISAYATIADVNQINANLSKSIESIESQIPNFSTKQDLIPLATKEEVNNVKFEVDVIKQEIDNKADIDYVNTKLQKKVDWDNKPWGESITLSNNKRITYNNNNNSVEHNIIQVNDDSLTIGDHSLGVIFISDPNKRIPVLSSKQEEIAYVSDIKKLQEEIDNGSELSDNKYATKKSVEQLNTDLTAKIDLKANITDVTELTNIVNTKASQSDLDTTNQLVNTKASQLDLDKANANILLKASQEDVDTLKDEMKTKVSWNNIDNGSKSIRLDYADKLQAKDVNGEYNDVVSVSNKTLNIGNYNSQITYKTLDGSHLLCSYNSGKTEEIAFVSDITASSTDISDKITIINNNITNIQNDMLNKADKDVVDGLSTSLDEAKADILNNANEISDIKRTKQDTLTAGKGISIQSGTISCTFDESPYVITNSLPEEGNPNKIYVVPSTESGAPDDNNKVEYLYNSDTNTYEKFGSFQPKVDLEPYALKTDLLPYALKTEFPQLIEGFVDSKVNGLAVASDVTKQINDSALSVTNECKQYAREQDILVRNDLSQQITSETQKQNEAINNNSQAIIVLQNRCDHFDDIIGQITVEHGHGITSKTVANVYTKPYVDEQISLLKAEIARLKEEINAIKK